MSNRTWHSGPPPHVGWWNASVCRAHDAWRWWNGQQWSRQATFEEESPRAAGKKAVFTGTSFIEWTDYYPENARVPRIKP